MYVVEAKNIEEYFKQVIYGVYRLVVNAIVLGCFCSPEYILVGNGIEILEYTCNIHVIAASLALVY